MEVLTISTVHRRLHRRYTTARPSPWKLKFRYFYVVPALTNWSMYSMCHTCGSLIEAGNRCIETATTSLLHYYYTATTVIPTCFRILCWAAAPMHREHRRSVALHGCYTLHSLGDCKAFSGWTRWRIGGGDIPVPTLSNRRTLQIHWEMQSVLWMVPVPSQRPFVFSKQQDKGHGTEWRKRRRENKKKKTEGKETGKKEERKKKNKRRSRESRKINRKDGKNGKGRKKEREGKERNKKKLKEKKIKERKRRKVREKRKERKIFMERKMDRKYRKKRKGWKRGREKERKGCERRKGTMER